MYIILLSHQFARMSYIEMFPFSIELVVKQIILQSNYNKIYNKTEYLFVFRFSWFSLYFSVLRATYISIKCLWTEYDTESIRLSMYLHFSYIAAEQMKSHYGPNNRWGAEKSVCSTINLRLFITVFIIIICYFYSSPDSSTKKSTLKWQMEGISISVYLCNTMLEINVCAALGMNGSVQLYAYYVQCLMLFVLFLFIQITAMIN